MSRLRPVVKLDHQRIKDLFREVKQVLRPELAPGVVERADEVHASVALKEAGVLELFRQGQISIRKAAELLGLSYRGFLELASRHQISLVNYEEGWIDQELEILDKVKKQAI